MNGTTPLSPPDLLRPIRCMAPSKSSPTHDCYKRHGDIDWNEPQTQKWLCDKCKTLNIVRIVAVRCEAPCCQTF